MRLFGCIAVVSLLVVSAAGAAELQVLLPLARTAYQTNETIDVSVVRSSTSALATGNLRLDLKADDDSVLSFTFAVPAAPQTGNLARRTEHLHLNGWLLRPGAYTLDVQCDGAAASAKFDVFSHVRKSEFRLINWGRAQNAAEQRPQGEDSLGYNLFYGGYGNDDEANFIRAGVDYMANCVMSGGHQMDLRLECDWSDPYVTRGGTMRVVRRAMIDRTRPNVPGVHFYDEPGLTWHKHPVTGEFGPHGVPAQMRAYAAAFGSPPPEYHTLDPKNPEHVARWKHWATWKLGFMDAAWKEAQFGVSRVRSDFLSLTQSQYGWSAFTDGYYFNVARSLPITSGHGGYHDFGLGFFNPSYFLEMSRARDQWKPCWYLPTWYGNTTSDEFRLEQYLSFQTGIQGMMSPPDLEPAKNTSARQGIVETNRLFQQLGPIFNTPSQFKPPVAMLFSLSNCIHEQTQDRSKNYAHAIKHGENLPLVYLAGKLMQHQFQPVLDEDILDGTLTQEHRAIVLTSISYLDPKVVAVLEKFAEGGGLVLLTGDCTVSIKGATKLDVVPRMPDQEKIDELMKAQKYGELGPFQTVGKFYAGAAPVAAALRGHLEKADIHPIFQTDVPSIIATRHEFGDAEYIFAVNATWNDATPDQRNGLKAVTARITLADDGRTVYDAVRGGAVVELQNVGDSLVGAFRFGPGQMRVFVRSARPIGGLKLAKPTIQRDRLRPTEPCRVDISGALLDSTGGLLSGSVPVRIQVVDPKGNVRHEVDRSTRQGLLSLSLPLAANDPFGDWKVVVRDLVANTESSAAFVFVEPYVRTLAGATERAVFAANDRENCFRFARTHHDATLVCGSSPFNQAAAKRLTEILAPWGIRCREMPLAEAAKSRMLSDEEAKTWVGLTYASSGQIKAGPDNPPLIAGFAVQGPVILLGHPDDHPILKFLQTERFLPYAPKPGDFPGQGRGMVAWQRDGIGRGQESIALIAHDEAGMNEAVGSLYEAIAGIDPLTPWTIPEDSDLKRPVEAGPPLPSRRPAKIAWTATLPDRVLSLSVKDGKLRALTHDGSSSVIGPDVTSEPVPADAAELAAARQAAPVLDENLARVYPRDNRIMKLTAVDGTDKAIAYWGGTLWTQVTGKETEQLLPQDVTALVWWNRQLVVGLADGRVLGLEVR